MPGAGLTLIVLRKVPSDMPALEPYWGKPTVRNFRGGDGNVGIIRSPLRAITLPDRELFDEGGVQPVPIPPICRFVALFQKSRT